MISITIHNLAELDEVLNKLTDIVRKRDEVQYKLHELLVVYTPIDNGFGHHLPAWKIYMKKEP